MVFNTYVQNPSPSQLNTLVNDPQPNPKPLPNPQKEPLADILIVDDTLENLRLLSAMLTQYGYNIRKALNGRMALTAVQTIPPDIILLDIMMPDLTGYEVCETLKQNPQTAEIPVIFLTALNDAFDKVQAFQVGGIDYITKPFQIEEVVIRVQHHLALQKANQEIREWNATLEKRVSQRTHQLEDAVRELHLEITERKRVQQKLLYLAHHDALTGLPNRVSFMEKLQAEIKQSNQVEGYQFALLFLDCDRFKFVNDSLGHLAGDRLLVLMAKRLTPILTDSQIFARLGGDEFALLLPNITHPQQVYHLAEKILQKIRLPFSLGEREVFISASIGIVFSELRYQKPEHLLRDADTAMYQAKALGKGRYEVFHPQMHDRALQTLQLETDLRNAIARKEFVVYYQPLVNLKQGCVIGFEALVRWNHPQKGLLSPGQFLTVAEETGLIIEMGMQVLQSACQQLSTWQKAGLASADLCMSVNLTSHQFAQKGLVEQIDTILETTGINSQNLKLEITESAIITNSQAATEVFQQLKDRQIQLSIDDFGTGYSSLSYLNSFPIDILKIDKSFVQSWDGTTENMKLIPTILRIAQTMGMTAIAEGIETPQQLDQLRALSCDCGQGYLFSRPVPAEDAIALVNQQW